MLKTHFRRARELRERFNGYEIKLIGDAYMVIFHTGREALGFAKEFVLNPGLSDLFIRVAIHVGGITISDGDVYGIMVNYTARLIDALNDPRWGRRMRLPGPSGIVVSPPAKSQIIAAHGQSAGDNFKDVVANLRSFGQETVCFYSGLDVMAPLLSRYKQIREQAASLPPLPGAAPTTPSSRDQSRERLSRLVRQPAPDDTILPSPRMRRPLPSTPWGKKDNNK